MLLLYATSEGAAKINQLPGIWESTIDEHWVIQCNGHPETIDHILPYSWSIEYNGFPAGILSIHGEGILCAGEMANEQALIAAIERKMNSKGATGEDTNFNY